MGRNNINYFKSIISIFFIIFFCKLALTEEYISTAKQIIGEYLIGGIENNTPDFIKTLDIEYIHSDDYDSTFSLNAVSSIYEGDTDVFFNQTSVYQHDGNTTLNTGLAYRNLFSDKKIIFGVNAFYDREIKVTHQRVGLGVELLTSVFDLRSNIYESFSKTKLVESNNTEKALDGWDLRGDYHLPSSIVDDYRVSLFTSYYDWSESGGDFSSDGYKIGFTGRPYKNLFLEAAIDDDGSSNKDFYFLLNYSLKLYESNNELTVNSGNFELQNVEHRMYEKVIRENRIVKVVKGAVKVKRGN
ncbi:MAG: hypothetical protein CFH33_00947 [Alphaproteobacteria bacterium MarineAlpha9_Bin3]|nr:MAG: hypothetical protein CFH33_00947 [Alphaproteobacteria bacterium MarineAlpha9_Bin3]